MLTCLLLVSSACKGREGTRTSNATGTVAPPAPQPAPTGTDAMTQTVDIEDSRSVDDGGILTNPQTARTGTTATTATTSTVTKTVKKKSKK